MCGIFGIISRCSQQISSADLKGFIRDLFLYSEARGIDSSGLAIQSQATQSLSVYKANMRPAQLLKSAGFSKFLDTALNPLFNSQERLQEPVALFGHSRLVTNGTQLKNFNNQPVVKDEVVLIHNGIVTNVDELWQTYAEQIERHYDVDTEVLASLLRYFLKQGCSLSAALAEIFRVVEGAISAVIATADSRQIILCTNTGSLYTLVDKNRETLLFASEEYTLRSLCQSSRGAQIFSESDIHWVVPQTGLVVEPHGLSLIEFSLTDASQSVEVPYHVGERWKIDEQGYRSENEDSSPSPVRLQSFEQQLEYHPDEIDALHRCSRCILPETFPFIEFDEARICNYCRNYTSTSVKQAEHALHTLLEQYRDNSGKIRAIVALSGGRDSSFGLHYLREEIGLDILTFTYDWGMVTDLARRNIARMTGKLGIENILCSADIAMKRRNIRDNVTAWLRKPELGIIPLFMAGDKHFFSYMNRIKQQTRRRLNIWCTNHLENTDFKVGFCGISPNFNKGRIDELTWQKKAALLFYFGRNFLQNPGYLNPSIVDSLSAFYSYYSAPRSDCYNLFNYIPWNEETITRTLIDQYNWELSPDTSSSWRIGDGTAPFYNYVYYTVAGFTEFDTFRSNQIREGQIQREHALELTRRENRPRLESLLWYFETINVDFSAAIKRINSIPKLYRMQTRKVVPTPGLRKAS
jgi:glutamine---fructose-6-phosphate transaminase (isomerizing)